MDANVLHLLPPPTDGVAQQRDTDILVAISAFPRIDAGTNVDPTIVHFDEFIGYDI